MPPLGTPLADSKFTLSSASVAGFFGGREAVAAMATVHLYEGRRHFGWYNSPGSYITAQYLGQMANSRFWKGLFPDQSYSQAISFGLDGKSGPKFIAALSGTVISTGHLAYLTLEESKEIPELVVEGRKTRPVDVAYLSMNHVDYDTPLKRAPVSGALLGLIPIAVSIAACVMCALVNDWFSFSMILLGIVANGMANFVVGARRLVMKSVNPPPGAPPGHGILLAEDMVMVVKGDERDVSAITKGHFALETEERDAQRHHTIGMCSLFLIAQFLLQLFLIPQGTLFGQIMFVGSLGVSWAYNAYLSSLEKEKIQTRILLRALGNPYMTKFRMGTRTTMTVFVCLLLFHEVGGSTSKLHHEKILRTLLPNDTAVWRLWRDKVIMQLLHADDQSLSHLEEDETDGIISDSERSLLKALIGDAKSAFKGYSEYRRRL